MGIGRFPYASKALRPKQRVHQIDKEKDRCNSSNCIFHKGFPRPLKALRGFREAPHQGKEHNHDGHIKQIQHDSPHNRQEHDVMSCLHQSAGKFFFPRPPPAFLRSNHDQRPRFEHLAKAFKPVSGVDHGRFAG